MPSAGDSFIVELKPAHLQWGTRGPSRSGQNRSPMEAYIQISQANASKYGIMQGEVFNAVSADGYLNCQVLAGGSQGPNLEYAKQFEGYGNLKLLGYWLINYCKAEPGDHVHVHFTSPTDVVFSYIP